MRNEKLSIWTRVGNSVNGFFDLLELLYAIPFLLITMLIGIVIAPFNLFFEIIKYIFGNKK